MTPWACCFLSGHNTQFSLADTITQAMRIRPKTLLVVVLRKTTPPALHALSPIITIFLIPAENKGLQLLTLCGYVHYLPTGSTLRVLTAFRSC